MKVAYYPGCSGRGTSVEYEKSTQVVCSALGVELQELADWSCCGSTPAHATDAALSAALCARNLNIAAEHMDKSGATRLTTPCPSCLANLKTARHHLHDADFRAKVDSLLDLPCPPLDAKGNEPLPETVSTLQVLLEDVGLDAIAAKVQKPLTGIKIAPYYGCLLSRPKGIMQFDCEENPVSMDKILTALGAEVIPFPLKTECCGAAMGIPRRDITARLSSKILTTARNYGADAVAVCCPLCHMNLDLRQDQAAKAGFTLYNMPVLYFTQFMGIAFGYSASELGLDKLCNSPAAMLQKIQTAKAETDKEASA